jgi:hypothetical protein
MLNLAGEIRDYPGMNFHLWLKAFLTVSLERRDLITLRKPNPLELSPEHFLSKDNYRDAVNQAELPPDQRVIRIHYMINPAVKYKFCAQHQCFCGRRPYARPDEGLQRCYEPYLSPDMSLMMDDE